MRAVGTWCAVAASAWIVACGGSATSGTASGGGSAGSTTTTGTRASSTGTGSGSGSSSGASGGRGGNLLSGSEAFPIELVTSLDFIEHCDAPSCIQASALETNGNCGAPSLDFSRGLTVVVGTPDGGALVSGLYAVGGRVLALRTNYPPDGGGTPLDGSSATAGTISIDIGTQGTWRFDVDLTMTGADGGQSSLSGQFIYPTCR